jgi:CheY-like chemotaxis protein
MSRVIVVADDDPSLRMMLVKVLEAAEFEVVAAGDGFEALLKVGESTPCALVIDVSLPGISGVRLTEVLRSQDAWKDLPIIGISGYELPVDEARVFTMFMHKPFSPDALVQALGRLCPPA